MNIAFDAKRAFHNTRGLGNYSRDTIRLLSFYFPEHSLLLFNPSSKKRVDFPLAKNVREFQPQSLLGKTFPAIWRSYGMCQQIKSLKPDLFHGLSQELPFGIKKTGVKSVVTMHDAIFMRYPELYSSVYRSTFIIKNKYACKEADRIIAISERTKLDFIDYFHVDEKKIDVVYQGCNSLFRQPVSTIIKKDILKKYNLPEMFLLSVGAIEKRKNTALIIEALHQFHLDVPLVIIGKPTIYMNELLTIIQKYNMEKQVIFVYDVETVDLPAIYTMAEIFIYPSIFEGFGIPVLEALCSGTPVIASKGSCFEETGGPYSRYINPSDAEELGYTISQILSDNEMKSCMKKEGLIFSERFTDDKIANQLMKVYKSI